MDLIAYQDDHRDQIIELLSENDREDFFFRKKTIWNWQFIDNPNCDTTCSLLVFREDGRIMGFFGTMPVRIKYYDSYYKALWGSDFVVRSEYRRKGYGKMIFNEFQKLGPVMLALGVNNMSLPILLKNRWRVNDDIESYTYSNKISAPRDIVKRLLQNISKIRKNERFRATEFTAEHVKAAELPIEIDLLWKSVESGYKKTVIRDHSYLKWRYGDHPFSKYELILVRNHGLLVALGVYRRNDRFSRLVDYVGPSQNSRIKYFIIDQFMKKCSDSMVLECLCTDRELKQCLSQAGFRRYRIKPRFLLFSNTLGDPFLQNDWFVMAGDADEDIPQSLM
jgi:GNAT superfamily N-acetyltransferase